MSLTLMALVASPALAWPTAKFDLLKFGGPPTADGGFDRRIRLIGTSAFDGSLTTVSITRH